MSESDRFDETALPNLERMVGTGAVREIVALFLQNAPARIEEARAGARKGDAASLARAVHSLKSSAAMVGAEELRGLAEKMELLAEDGEVEDATGLLDRLERAYARTASFLRRMEE